MILQRGKLGFWEESYINNIFLTLQKDFFWKKNSFGREKAFRDQKKILWKNLLHKFFSKAKGKAFSFSKKKSIRTNKEKYQKIYFLHCSSFKHSIEANKIQGSQFSSQEHNQNGEHPLKGESILHQASTFSSSSFISLFNSISILFLVDN